MIKLFDMIFRRDFYNEVISMYEKILGPQKTAYKIWLKTSRLQHSDDYEFKRYILSHWQEIKELDFKVSLICGLESEAIPWFYHDAQKSTPEQLGTEDYIFLLENEEKLHEYDIQVQKYNNILEKFPEAVKRFTSKSVFVDRYAEITAVLSNMEKILEIDAIIRRARSICDEFRGIVWDGIFANGREFQDIPTEELASLNKEDFLVAEKFIDVYGKKLNQAKLIIGADPFATDITADESIKRIKYALEVDSIPSVQIPEYKESVHIEGDELKRAILNSTTYGKTHRLKEDDDFETFYELREILETKNQCYDSIIDFYLSNIDAINAFNDCPQPCLLSVRDVMSVIRKNRRLLDFIDKFNADKKLRISALKIKGQYPFGFAASFGNDTNIETCDMEKIRQIISQEDEIRICDEEEKKRIEHERRQKEQEKKSREISDLLNAVKDWEILPRADLPYFSLYYYYPTTCEWEAGDHEWELRNLIWDFKANPNKPQDDIVTELKHENAEDIVIPQIKKVLKRCFGTNLKKLTLVCIPSSKQKVSEKRYKTFSENLCRETGMTNGYQYVKVICDGGAAHLGGVNSAEYQLDDSFFAGRYVLLFDDVITTGKSMRRFKDLLTRYKSYVIAGMSLGLTRHEYAGTDPIDKF